MRESACLLLALLLSFPARAADWQGSFRTARGQPVGNVVVTVYPAAGGGPPPRAEGSLQMVQRDMQFDPFVLVVPVGGEVTFPNRDSVRHHVYSFSPAKTFELKLYGKEETRKVRFDKAGSVAVGCNIHDSMVAFIKVVDTGLAARSAESGDALVRGLPPGPATLKIWHPYLKAPGNEVSRRIVVPASGVIREALVLDLRGPPTQRRGAY